MTPEQLVPTLETCKLLKEAGYPQGKSCFSVWTRGNWENILDDGTTEPALYLGTNTFPKENKMWGECLKMYAAPTLQELLEELPDELREYARRDAPPHIFSLEMHKFKQNSGETLYSFCYEIRTKRQPNSNAAEATALLWLELHKEGER